MANALSPGTAKKEIRTRKAQAEKHLVVPATAEQISQGVGVTKKDAALVDKVLRRLGYLSAEKSPKGRAKVRSSQG